MKNGLQRPDSNDEIYTFKDNNRLLGKEGIPFAAIVSVFINEEILFMECCNCVFRRSYGQDYQTIFINWTNKHEEMRHENSIHDSFSTSYQEFSNEGACLKVSNDNEVIYISC